MEHTPTHQNAFLSSAREKEDPFFYRRLLDVVVVRDDERDRLFLLALFAFLFSVKERKRESIQMAIGDAARTNPANDDGAAPLPIVATENATETTDGGIDRSVHPSGIVPTLQCVLFLFFYVYSNDERDETMRSSRRFEFD